MTDNQTTGTRELAEPDFDRWGDRRDEWSDRIDASHPMRGGSHETFATAMEMVGNRHSKVQLVRLVSWLLQGQP